MTAETSRRTLEVARRSTPVAQQPPAGDTAERPRLSTPSWPAGIEPTPEFATAVDFVLRRDGDLFVTGRAGTGKSTLLRVLRDTLGSGAAVLAPTGLAAVGVGGQTIHSFFRFPPRLVRPEDVRRTRNGALMRRLDTLIIDEVSMVRADLMDGIDRALRLNRGRPDEPFGGVQLVLFGDLHQLPPVVREVEAAAYLAETFGGPFFFNAPAFRDGRCELLELGHVFRQSDERFIRVLNAIREGDAGPDDLATLNARVAPLTRLRDAGDHVIITTTNEAAYRINMAFLEALPGREVAFDATLSGEYPESAYPTDPSLVLKVGAKVIMIRNDPQKRWVNGTLAKIVGIEGEKVTIEIGGQVHELEPTAWEAVRYAYDTGKDAITPTVAGTFKQLPIRLAWALTIHKAQGLTLDKVYIDLGRGSFAHGQTYVALSRCRSLEGLVLSRALGPRDIIFDTAATGYRDIFSHLGRSSISRPF
jgi:ATP-dependent exoDNAse (exonuclease V) alpha subunit